MDYYKPPPKISVTITLTDPGWSEYDPGPAIVEVLKTLEDGSPPRHETERLKPPKATSLDQAVPLERFFNIPETYQRAALRGTAFKSWSEFNLAVRKRIAAEAGASLVAAAYIPSPPIVPEHHELLFFFPVPRIAMYRDTRTGADVVLRRVKGVGAFEILNGNTWEVWTAGDD